MCWLAVCIHLISIYFIIPSRFVYKPLGATRYNSGTLYYLHADRVPPGRGSTVPTTSGANATEQCRAYGAVHDYSGSNAENHAPSTARLLPYVATECHQRINRGFCGGSLFSSPRKFGQWTKHWWLEAEDDVTLRNPMLQKPGGDAFFRPILFNPDFAAVQANM